MPVFANRPQGLQERLSAVGFVQDDDAVVGGEAGINRPSARAFAISAKQQGGTNLVNCGSDDGRLARVALPAGCSRYAAAQSVNQQRLRMAAAGQHPQPVGYYLDDARFGVSQFFGEGFGAVISLVNYVAPVDGIKDAAGMRTS